jgi:hypothetical protein
MPKNCAPGTSPYVTMFPSKLESLPKRTVSLLKIIAVLFFRPNASRTLLAFSLTLCGGLVSIVYSWPDANS